MKSVIRTIEKQDGFYPGDGLEDMYRPKAYTAYGEANEMDRVNARYERKSVLVKRSVRRYTHG